MITNEEAVIAAGNNKRVIANGNAGRIPRDFNFLQEHRLCWILDVYHGDDPFGAVGGVKAVSVNRRDSEVATEVTNSMDTHFCRGTFSGSVEQEVASPCRSESAALKGDKPVGGTQSFGIPVAAEDGLWLRLKIIPVES
jgi:hypothetical protein